MVNLIGTYDCKVDLKGRLMVPSALKKQLVPVLQDGFIMKRSVFEPCLELYPMERWNVIMAKMNKLNPFDRKINAFIRTFTAGVKNVEVDTNGRLLIPKELTERAGIDKEIVLAAAMGHIEIWDKEKYEATLSDSTEGFAELAEEVMGNVWNDGVS